MKVFWLILSIFGTFVPTFFFSLPPASDEVQRLVQLYSPYQTVTIDDPAQNSSGLYFRISQRGVDYLAELTSDGLPDIFRRMVLPTISESGLTLKDTVITRLDRPDILVKFVKGHGVDISIRLPELRVTGAADLSVFFASYGAQVVAISQNLTVNMRVAISKDLDQAFTNVTVTRCSVNPGTISLKYFGAEASEFYTVGNLIQDGIDSAIRDNICLLPPLVREFVQEQIDQLMKPQEYVPLAVAKQTKALDNDVAEDVEPSVFDHLCGQPPVFLDGDSEPLKPSAPSKEESNAPEVDMDGEMIGNLVPDLTLRYPPTFSDQDLIFGIDGGILYNGHPAPTNIERPKFEHLAVRDQMLGLIMSEYIPNTFFYHIYNNQMGHVSVTYSLKHVPKVLRSIARLVCPDCKLVISANLTTSPQAAVDRNGIILLLEGDIAANFRRKNQSYNILTANGQIRVGIKPHFRHSRLYSDVLLAGVDFKVYKAGMTGYVAGAVKKLISFLIPRAIWPKIQQRLRLAVNYKGIQIPRFCSVEFNHLHLDYVQHAAIISGDFNVDLPVLIGSFKRFMDEKLKHTHTRKQQETEFRYL